MSIKEDAVNKKYSEAIKKVAEKEKQSIDFLIKGIINGDIVVFKNKNRDTNPCAVGRGLSIKINANIGTSPLSSDIEFEIQKLAVAEAAGADSIMDLSIGGDINGIRKTILKKTKLPIGTVPIYQTAYEKICNKKDIAELKIKDFLSVIEAQAKEGVDFMTIHAGVTKESISRLENEKRILGVVSRGGAILLQWIKKSGNENPYFEYYDEVLDILKEHDVVISLGDGMRPGCLADATDRCQINEMIILGELTERAWKKGVQVIIEGPGHVPIEQIHSNMQIAKRLCHNAPFYVLGPLVTDIAPGYDHITSAIGGAIASGAGADFLCYVTPAEHLRLPTIEDVREGVITAKIAAHIGDLSRGIFGAKERNDKMSIARKNLDWNKMFELAIDPQKAKQYRENSDIGSANECTMCGEFCSIRQQNEISD